MKSVPGIINRRIIHGRSRGSLLLDAVGAVILLSLATSSLMTGFAVVKSQQQRLEDSFSKNLLEWNQAAVGRCMKEMNDGFSQ